MLDVVDNDYDTITEPFGFIMDKEPDPASAVIIMEVVEISSARVR